MPQTVSPRVGELPTAKATIQGRPQKNRAHTHRAIGSTEPRHESHDRGGRVSDRPNGSHGAQYERATTTPRTTPRRHGARCPRTPGQKRPGHKDSKRSGGAAQ